MTSTPAGQAMQLRAPRSVIFLVLAIGLYLASAEYSALNVALPTLGRTLRAGEGSLALIVDAFGLWQAGVLIPGGAFGDRYGRRRAFVFGLTLIAIGAAAAARATSTGELIAARGVMGIGAGLEIPAFLGTLRSIYRTEAQRRQIAMTYSAVIGVGVASGPALGGWVIGTWGIHWVFWGTGAIAILALSLSWVLPQTRDPHPPRTDLLAAGLAILGLGALLWAVIEAPANGWTSPRTIAALTGGLVCMLGVAQRQRTARHPLIDRGFVRSPRLWGAAAAIMVAYAIVGGTLFALAPQLQLVVGYGPLQAGLHQMPAAGAAIAGTILALVSERLRWRPIVVLGTGFGLIGAAEMVCSMVGPQSGYRPLLWTMVLGGLGWGLVTARMSGVIMDILPRSQASAAAGVDEANRQTALIVGVALASTLINIVFRRDLAPALTGLPSTISDAARGNVAAAAELASRLGHAGLPLGEAARAAYTHALDHVAVTFSGTAAAAVVVVVLVSVRSHLQTSRPVRGRHAAGLMTQAGAAAVGFAPDPVRRRERERRMADPQGPLDARGLQQRRWYDGLAALVDLAGAVGTSSLLPAHLSAADRGALQAAGVEFGPLTEDLLFLQVTLPRGWRMELNWESRRVELLDASEIVQAVITYRPSFNAGQRRAGMALALRADGVRDAEEGYPVQSSASSWFTPPTAHPETMSRALTSAGLRAIADAPKAGVWALTPRGCTVDEALVRLGFKLGAGLEGDELFQHVLPPLGWRFELDEPSGSVQVLDADGCLRLEIMYSKTAADRWAAVLELTPPVSHVEYAQAG